jgi:hypothetical protein
MAWRPSAANPAGRVVKDLGEASGKPTPVLSVNAVELARAELARAGPGRQMSAAITSAAAAIAFRMQTISTENPVT